MVKKKSIFLLLLSVVLFFNFYFLKKIRWIELHSSKYNKYMRLFDKNRIFWFAELGEIGFKDNQGVIFNDDCSDLKHWFIKGSENEISLSEYDWCSSPGAVRIKINVLPCSLYYVKGKKIDMKDENTWSFKNFLFWWGVKSNTKVKLSFNYKGAGPTIYLNILKLSSRGSILDFRNLKESVDHWQEVELSQDIPLDARALQLEIVVNKTDTSNTLLIDDLRLEII